MSASFVTRVLAFGSVCALQVGCVPAILQRTPHVSGHVIDAGTHRPVPQAQVKFRNGEKPVALTDADGRFDLPKTHKLTIVVLLPLDRFETFSLEVTKTGYFPAQVRVHSGTDRTGDVQLKAAR